jgi:hypothetical protein
MRCNALPMKPVVLPWMPYTLVPLVILAFHWVALKLEPSFSGVRSVMTQPNPGG